MCYLFEFGGGQCRNTMHFKVINRVDAENLVVDTFSYILLQYAIVDGGGKRLAKSDFHSCLSKRLELTVQTYTGNT